MQKLILFDIDGTLLTSAFAGGIEFWKERVMLSGTEVFGIPFAKPDPSIVNGFVDRNMFWYLAEKAGIPRKEFDRNYKKLNKVFHDKTRKHFEEGHVGWKAIPQAKELLIKIKDRGVHAVGVITGNTEANGWLKLESAGLREYIEFGAFADTVDDRFKLAAYALKESSKYFGKAYSGVDIVIVGDTRHDVRSGKSIGATTIAVNTGYTETIDTLKQENPDLLVESLMDEQVLRLLELV